MARKPRSNAVSEHVRIAQGASAEIVPPAHVPLDDGDRPFWDSVIAEFARADWTAHQLELAAMLARMMADLEREQMLLRREGAVMSSERGTPVVNPRKTVVQMTAGSILSMRRSLALHARAQAGDNRHAATKKQTGKAVEANVIAVDDDFIPRAIAH
jgi:hypothetical protein